MRTTGLLFTSLSFLDWWLLAVVIALADVFVLRGWLLAIAAAAGVTGFVLMLFPQLSGPWQLLIFSIIALGGLGWRWRKGSQSVSRSDSAAQKECPMSNFHDFEIKTINGQPKSLNDFNDSAVLVVNVASKCGLTPQYAGLEKLQREFKDKGFTVLGFPCNQFGAQEPGSETEIQQFCSTNYQVTFPMTSKIDVNGEGAHPLYKWLKAQTGGDDIQWNFEKFLIGKDGSVLARFRPMTEPEAPEVVDAIEASLAG